MKFNNNKLEMNTKQVSQRVGKAAIKLRTNLKAGPGPGDLEDREGRKKMT